jgi:hypothetical protein
LDKLSKHQPILRAFVGLWPNCQAAITSDFSIAEFKEFLAKTDADGKEELVEELYRIFDLSTPQGHEYLIDACRLCSFESEFDRDLHVECLGLMTRTERPDAFDLAYDMHTVHSAERFSLYKGRGGKRIQDPQAGAKSLQDQLAQFFLQDKRSDRVIVRQFEDGQRTNFVIYHEKRRKAELTFRGSSNPSVRPLIFRPVQQDLICYDSTTGTAEIETGFQKEEEALRRAFAGCCLNDEELFEDEKACNQIDLSPLKNRAFVPHVEEGHSVSITELHAGLVEGRGPTMILKSKNVLRTLDNFHLREVLLNAVVRRVVIKFYLGDDRRGCRVEGWLPNNLRFKRAKHADAIFAYLRRWRLLSD